VHATIEPLHLVPLVAMEFSDLPLATEVLGSLDKLQNAGWPQRL
jgi:hypothetical protein